MTHEHILNCIGNTPLVHVNLETPPLIYAKLEYLNPGGSIKDRTADYMIKYAEQHGLLKPGGNIIDASSGNHGIALAMIGALKGYTVTICVTEKISQEKLKTIQAYGARTIMCPNKSKLSDPESYLGYALKLYKENTDSFMPNQYLNPLNAQAHYATTGPEIWRQTHGTITHLIVAAGTGGTISGVGRYLKEQNKNIKIIALDSINSYRATKGNPKICRVEGLGIDLDSPVIDYSVIDDIIEITDEDAFKMAKNCAHKKGFLVGPSSGAVVFGTYHYTKKLPKSAVVVMILSDSGRAYLSKYI